ncbi:centrosomal protein of 120 kDa [Dicentrarchus labrax]|uniref:Centrosomal protein 120 n=1 Tax=Dicentrarchus labrax TaxID=13489 RepID=A0A8P4KQ76_DICLA|nr:centrosomal protein of 120 kDa [Dicentrarchus labrax]XP_051277826.1 centrosomal protein of 120 kDa [Dicentrarchus labrax]XP_051277827.1 centrosomal protein of 120 kDa [Dicentrarchus labrax]XP_051277828.1 centrosomal protein of 120 kDa [Dicentrarchus labrax]XP_051277829.1 centrosomal protein of 120 kDa [Dicentrarchus labrax]XP_051277830.1 centrosomal protein of 120 kDa [Dicentrarchus labrax]
MASKTDQLLIVVSILEGRHFPKSPRLSLVVQASFDGEQLATDPVEHRDQPQFSTELAWELDRRTLHQHRLQRTPIKLQCFAVDSVSKKRESVGYIVLDLRSVQEVRQEPRWYPLLSSKYTKQRPALLLGMVLENDTKPSEPSPDRFKAKKAPPRQGSPAVTDLLPDNLDATLIPDQGYHQVGPADHCSDMFILSVTVAFATKLEQLIPSTKKLSAEGSKFFFYYSLLGNDITSEPFHNLLSPDFEPERASVRIRSSKQILQAFLSQQPSLQIHLCCGNHSLGSTDVSLSALSAVSVDLENKAATVEGAFVLQPPKRVKQTLPALPADLQPTVGVAVTLRREEVAPQSLGNKGSGAQTHSNPAPPSVPPSVRTAEQRPRSSSPIRKPPDSSPPGPPLPPPSSHTESEAESLLEEFQQGKEQAGLAAADLEVPVQLHTQTEATAEGGASSVSVSAPKVSIPSSAHHYCFSLDLHSLGSLSLTHPIAATLRYSYQFFGSPAPIMTNPPVELQRNMEASLPQSYCAFDFAALPQQLQDTFLRVPLVVEVWHRDSTSRDQLIGRASIQLSHLLSSERSKLLASTGEQSWRQSHQDRIPVVKTHRPSEKVAELSYVATLEDLGLVKAREVIVSDSLQNEPAVPTKPSSHPAAPRPAAPSLNPAPLGPTAPTAPRDTLEYRTALELELWKEEQEDLFDDQLRKKELSHMQALAEEWRRRDREREALVKKKEVEYNVLEEQLQKTLSDLEKREKHLVEAELETQRLQRELRAEHDLTQRELQESGRRLQQECDHRMALDKDKVRLMEEERARLLQQIADGESRYKQLEKEFQLYREQQNIRPEFRLQSEINLLTLEKVELERKLESTTKSKLHYKQQWGRALKELARFKQREQENAMTRLKKQQAELEAMRLRYLATEQKEAVQQDRQELDNIRNELNRLKQQEDRLGPAHPQSVNESADEHLSRLLEERDTLLRTGVYTHEDRIIAELNRQIQDAMSGRGDL